MFPALDTMYLLTETTNEENEMNRKAFISWESYEEEDCYIISHLWVPVCDRGCGKGRELLRNAIAEMKKEGKHGAIKLSADSESEDPRDHIDTVDLVDFYESEGFDIEIAGDVVIMCMDI